MVEVDLEFVGFVLRRDDFVKLKPLALDRPAPEEARDVLALEIALDPDLIALDDPLGGVGEPLCKIAVGGQYQQAFCVFVESPGANQSRILPLLWQEVEDRVVLVWIGVRADIVARLVQDQGEVVLLAGDDPLPVDVDDGAAGGDGFANGSDAIIDFDTAFLDELLGLAAGANPGLGKEFLQTDFGLHEGGIRHFSVTFDPKPLRNGDSLSGRAGGLGCGGSIFS